MNVDGKHYINSNVCVYIYIFIYISEKLTSEFFFLLQIIRVERTRHSNGASIQAKRVKWTSVGVRLVGRAAPSRFRPLDLPSGQGAMGFGCGDNELMFL